MLLTTVMQEGGRNYALEIKGSSVSGDFVVEVDSSIRRISSAVWLIEEKAMVSLWLGDELVLPMESRNSVRFDQGLRFPKDWDGRILVKIDKALEPKLVLIHLEFDK